MAWVLPWTWSMRRRKIDKQDRLLSPRIFWWCLAQDVTSKDQCAETTPMCRKEQCKQLWNAPACFELVGDWGESSSFWNMEHISWIENVLGITSKPFSEKEEMNILAGVKSKWKNRMSMNEIQYVSICMICMDTYGLLSIMHTPIHIASTRSSARSCKRGCWTSTKQQHATTCNDVQPQQTNANNLKKSQKHTKETKRRAFCDLANLMSLRILSLLQVSSSKHPGSRSGSRILNFSPRLRGASHLAIRARLSEPGNVCIHSAQDWSRLEGCEHWAWELRLQEKCLESRYKIYEWYQNIWNNYKYKSGCGKSLTNQEDVQVRPVR